MNEPRVNIPEWTVSELSAALKKTVEDAYGFVRVRGEITGYRGPHSSGHVYFALKDEGAKIDAVIWRARSAASASSREEGLEVIATGRLTTYPGRSSYQIVIESLEPAGVGALMALLEERKKKLAAEGLFDEARKQLIPFLPAVIGVITSPTGAVIRDILHRLSDRFPRHVLVWPVRVQGDGSAEEVAAAIRGFNALPEGGRIAAAGRADRRARRRLARGPLVVQRGDRGARRGREHDPADLRGRPRDRRDADRFRLRQARPTPTAAAECAVPVRSDLLAQIDSLGAAATRPAGRAAWRRGAPNCAPRRARCRARTSCSRCRARSSISSPSACRARCTRTREIHHKQYLRCASRLSPPLCCADGVRARRRDAAAAQCAAGGLTAAVRANIAAHRQRIVRDRERVAALFERGGLAVNRLIERRFASLERADRLLAAFSYQGVLARGFALVRDPAGPPLRSAAAISPGQALDIEFSRRARRRGRDRRAWRAGRSRASRSGRARASCGGRRRAGEFVLDDGCGQIDGHACREPAARRRTHRAAAREGSGQALRRRRVRPGRVRALR